MVVALLLLLLIQTGTGLGANDDLVHEGPLARQLGKHLSDIDTDWHDFNVNLVLAAVCLHLAAIFFYRRVKGQDLVGPMIAGRKQLPEPLSPPRVVAPWRAIAALAGSAALVWVVATRA
jgi:cytochrome b